MRAFISRTFRDDEKEQTEAADHFTDLAREAGLEPISVVPKGGRKIPEQVLSEMRKCQIAIGIFTKRHKIEDKNAWTIPSSVIYEMGISQSLGLTIAGFLQKGVDRDELGLVGMEGWNIPEFNPKTMYRPNEGKKHLAYLAKLSPKVPELEGTYRFIRVNKRVEIFPNGYAIVSHDCRLQVQSENFRHVTHLLRVGENAGKSVKLGTFQEMNRASPGALWNEEPFFAFRILDPKSSELASLDPQILPTANCDDEQIEFEVSLQGQPSRELIINYEWSLGCYDMFPTSKVDLSSGLRKKDLDHCFSSYILGHGGIEDFSYTIVFYRPYEFERPPSLKVNDNAGNPTLIGGSFDVTKGASRDAFTSTKMSFAHLTAGEIIAEWVPA